MSEKRQNQETEQELEALQDDDLQNVAGGVTPLPDIRIGKPGKDDPDGAPDMLSGGANRKPGCRSVGVKR